MGRRTRSCCCRSIRNSRARRRRRRSPLGTRRRRAAGSTVPTRAVCCYPTEAGLHRGARRRDRARRWPTGRSQMPLRVLLSAHGLPQAHRRARRSLSVAGRGDAPPRCARRWRGRISRCVVCYQSRVGPLRMARTRRPMPRSAAPAPTASAWSSRRSPSSRNIPRRWSNSTSNTAISPAQAGVPRYVRVPTVGDGAALHRRAGRAGAREAREPARALCPMAGGARCAASRARCCPCRGAAMSALAPFYPWIKALHIISVDRLDGGAALSAAAFRLSRRRARRARTTSRDLQGDGAAAAARHHEPGDDRDLCLRHRCWRRRRASSIGDAGWIYVKLAAVRRADGDPSLPVACWRKRLRRRPQPAAGAVLSHRSTRCRRCC